MRLSKAIGRRAFPAALLVALASAPGAAVAGAGPLETLVAASADYGVRNFYLRREHRPLWFRDGRVVPEARRLVSILRAAEHDGLGVDADRLAAAERIAADPRPLDPAALARAELLLSEAWIAHVQALAAPADDEMSYIDASLAPSRPFPAAILAAAAAAPSLGEHLREATAMNPLYQELHDELERRRAAGDVAMEAQLRRNLDRARALPRSARGKYVVVDVAAQRLYLFEDGRVRDTMKVVVGKASEPTPMAAGLIRSVVVNPYWNVPPDLVRRRIAPRVLAQGLGYLREAGFEPLAGWEDDAAPVDAAAVDWAAVAAGRATVRVRQLPGRGNAMGAMKFPFPNRWGVYLHDTPEKALFADGDRAQSSGCVRLEDAPRLARWLLGRDPAAAAGPEQAVPLPAPVPVYLTYLTAGREGQRLVLRRDIYGRDRPGVARAANTHGTESTRG